MKNVIIIGAKCQSGFSLLSLTYALPLLKISTGGSGFNISSVAGLRANPFQMAYAGSKYAVWDATGGNCIGG